MPAVVPARTGEGRDSPEAPVGTVARNQERQGGACRRGVHAADQKRTQREAERVRVPVGRVRAAAVRRGVKVQSGRATHIVVPGWWTCSRSRRAASQRRDAQDDPASARPRTRRQGPAGRGWRSAARSPGCPPDRSSARGRTPTRFRWRGRARDLPGRSRGRRSPRRGRHPGRAAAPGRTRTRSWSHRNIEHRHPRIRAPVV